MTTPKMYYSTSNMEADLQSMYSDMQMRGYSPDVIVGITRGGLVPSVYVSHYFNKPLNTIEVSFRDSGVKESCAFIIDHIRNGKEVLIVDDICDSGETLAWIYEQVDAFNSEYVNFMKTMVLIHNQGSTLFHPDYAGTIINKAEKNVWVVFPFEQND